METPSSARKGALTHNSGLDKTPHVYRYTIFIICIYHTSNSLKCMGMHTCNNTDGNKLMVFSSIALYYGDTYIIFSPLFLW